MKYKNFFILLLMFLSGAAVAAPDAGSAPSPAHNSVISSPLVEAMRPLERMNSMAQGLSLSQAMAQTYQSNPELLAAQAELRSVDESYAQAASGYRPVVTGVASYTASYQDEDGDESRSDPRALSVLLDQPLYRGGSTTANIRASANTIKAQRALLKATEQKVLLDTVTAYMDVVRDKEIIDLNINNEKVLSGHLDESHKRFELGDITKTDVSQSEARLANAAASRVAAEGNYRASRAAFEKTVGLSPDRLEKPDVNAIRLPVTLEEAQMSATDNNPDIVYSRYVSAAAKAATRSVIGEKLPQVDLSSSLGRTYDPFQGGGDRLDATSIGVTATLPLYTGGGTDSRIRQSRQIEEQRRREIDQTERSARQAVIDAWADLTAANAEMEARKSQIDAAQLALEGVKIEAAYGSRTTLDLLDAEQEYLDAQVAYVTAERNKIVAAYALLAASGGLTAENLHLPVALYDPVKNFQKVKDQWSGTDISAPQAGK